MIQDVDARLKKVHCRELPGTLFMEANTVSCVCVWQCVSSSVSAGWFPREQLKTVS